jgi:hypothetical protein
MLTQGYQTIQFNFALQDKLRTQVLGGGNTAEFYASEGTSAKSRMLKEAYPEYTELVWRFQREHHHVDYSSFKDIPLIRKPDLNIIEGTNNYGMELREVPPAAPGRV